MSDFIDETYERVEQIIIHNNMNIKSFENKINVSNNSVGTAIRRKASFKSSVLNKILNSFPDINPTWLLTGKGEMLLAKTNISGEPESKYVKSDLDLHVKKVIIELLSYDNEVKGLLFSQFNTILRKIK